jgi:redox-sensitive bicupin YhaK (pirin superfamily)
MPEHRNDEILSYMWRGTMVHEDSAGHRIPISPRKLMMMNAGRGFWHEESTPSEPVEMLQIFVRPEAADLPPHVAFWDRPVQPAAQEWQLIAGPEGSNAPLTIRQRVVVFDTHLAAGDEVVPPAVTGMTSWVYVMDGAIVAGDERLEKGDACSDADAPLPPLRASRDTTLVAFLVDLAAPASRSGTISGD